MPTYSREVFCIETRLKQRGLLPILEEVALRNHVPGKSILGRYETVALKRARKEFYIRVVLDEKIFSATEFARIIDRDPGTIKAYILAEKKRRAETDRIFAEAG